MGDECEKTKAVHVTDLTEDKRRKFEEMQMRVKKLREERVAKHAARIEMLKKMNLEKYSEKVNQGTNTSHVVHQPKLSLLPKSTTSSVVNEVNKSFHVKNVKQSKGTISCSKSPIAVQSPHKTNDKYSNIQTKVDCRRPIISKSVDIAKNTIQGPLSKLTKHTSVSNNTNPKSTQSIKPKNALNVSFDSKYKIITNRKWGSIPVTKTTKLVSQTNQAQCVPAFQKRISMSVNHLAKSKLSETNRGTQINISDFMALKKSKTKDMNKTNKTRESIHVSKCVEEEKTEFKEKSHMRRSLSTVHFKRMGPEAVKKCMRRTISVGSFRHKQDIEDELTHISTFKEYTLPVRSEMKKSVKFLTPLRKSNTPTLFLNTPKPSELKSRLNEWLVKRGKSLSSYHHLHCFGIHQSNSKDSENKENEEVYQDDSFEELKSGSVKDNAADWRRASYTLVDSPVVNSVDTGSQDVALDKLTNTNQLTGIGALENLQQLILEGYSWQQCAEWLDAIVRHCGDQVSKTAQYWECRAALEDKRGDFSRAVECYNKAILQGAQPAEVEESLDQLLQKFMKLNLDPEKKTTLAPDPKFLDVKNVFKSTLIRFAIQQKNIAESKIDSGNLINKYVATPVRRSSRLSQVPNSVKAELLNNSNTTKNSGIKNVNGKDELSNKIKSKTPIGSTGRKHLVQLCSTLQNVNGEIRNNLVFVPNKALNFNDL